MAPCRSPCCVMISDSKISTDCVGVGLKAPHYASALDGGHDLAFFEIHAENFMGRGGPPHRWLSAIRERYPISVHGVCLSVGGRDPIDRDHLDRLAQLVCKFSPVFVSEHLAWSADGGVFLNDLLPPPLTIRSLNQITSHIDEIQSHLKRSILIENPSSYLEWRCNDIAEPEFLNELVKRTGCGLLLDINNVFVSAINLGFDAGAYVDAINADAVCEIHLAGHAIDAYDNVTLRVDNHGSRISEEVLTLYERFVGRAGPRPTLIEWDTDVPSFHTLVAEAENARRRMAGVQPASEATRVAG